MAEQDVLPTYFGSLVPFYTGFDGAHGTVRGGPSTDDDPRELLTAVGNWADFCTAPRGTVIRHPAEPIDNFPGGTDPGYETDDDGTYPGPFSSGPAPHPADPDVWKEANDNRPHNLPMPGLTIDSFFDAANMLTGSDLAGIDKVWDVLRTDHNRFMQEVMAAGGDGDGPGPNYFFAVIEHILVNWSGEAQKAASLYSAALKDTFESQIRMTGWLADSVMAYTGIIVTARRQMLDLMRAFRETMRNKEKTSAQDDRGFTIGVVGNVLSALVAAGAAIITEVGTGGLGTALTAQFLTLAIGLSSQALSQAKPQSSTNTDGAAVAGDDYADIAVSYLHHAGEIVDEARAALYELVNGNAKDNPMAQLTVEGNWATPPKPLITSKQFDSDPSVLDDLGQPGH